MEAQALCQLLQPPVAGRLPVINGTVIVLTVIVAALAVGSDSSTYTPSASTVGTLYYYCVVTNSNGCTVTSDVSGGITVNNVMTSSAGSYMFCIDNSNTITTTTVNEGQYVVLDVIKGYNYTFTVANVFTGNENITILDDVTNSNVSPVATMSSATGASLSWTASISGRVKILLSSNNCTNGTSGGNMTLKLNSLGNTQENQAEYGTNTWVGHIYNWTGSAPPGGASSASPTATNPFLAANYAGYYNVAAETINEGFGGNNVCFNVYSNGAVRSIYTEQFAVRYKMKSTRPAGCYIATISGDDGLRLYVDNAKVFDEWKEQGVTKYENVLIYLNGNSDLVYDYYENAINNIAKFSLVPFDNTTNKLIAPSPATVCTGLAPGKIDGSNYVYNGVKINPKYQISVANFDRQYNIYGYSRSYIGGLYAYSCYNGNNSGYLLQTFCISCGRLWLCEL